MLRRKSAIAVAVFGLLWAVFQIMPLAVAQGRVNDKDMEGLMRNLRDDAKSFQPVFNDSIKRSTIRKTSGEKDARITVARFVKQTNAMLNRFKKTRKAEPDLPNVLATARDINKLVRDLNLNQQTTTRWEKVRTELHQVASAAGIPDSTESPSAFQ